MAQRLLLAAGIVFTVAGSLAPFLWFALTSFKTQAEVEQVPPSWLPSGGWHFYRIALFDHDLLAYVGNSIIVAGSTTLLALAIGIPAAYVLARVRLPGKSWILGGLLTVSMFPQMAIAGPVWRLLAEVHGLNTHWGLVLPYVTFSLPIVIWILASFFRELPAELEEAARVDGCTTWQTLTKIMLPLAAPGIFTAAILTGLGRDGSDLGLPVLPDRASVRGGDRHLPPKHRLHGGPARRRARPDRDRRRRRRWCRRLPGS